MRVRVHVSLKKSVFDPQGRTIHEALGGLGYAAVSDVRAGKFFDLAMEGDDAAAAKAQAEEMARRVLSNPVIEGFTVEVL
ncbi:MAG: phosphoribosylformylglycinamidine synthase subunit PurS [Vicinamibacteria bacterium]|nr:phosphoribosylformylglycinamidine synthase subunit PurS [Vicinamibacteria bacterium]